jgi:hypothetical protein
MRPRVNHIAIVSYSHGQAAATAFARLAYSYGLRIDLWLACDPVYRPTWAPRNLLGQLLSFRALIGDPKIRVPQSIRRVVLTQQVLTKPSGHTLIADNPSITKISKPIILPYSHTAIDSAPEWFEIVFGELKYWIKPPQAEPV